MPLSRRAQQYHASGETAVDGATVGCSQTSKRTACAESSDEVENIIEDGIFHNHDVFLTTSIIWPKIVSYETGKANHHCFPAESSGSRRSNLPRLAKTLRIHSTPLLDELETFDFLSIDHGDSLVCGATTLFDPTSDMRSFGIFTLAVAVTLSAFSWAAPLKADNGLVARADVITRRNIESVNIVARTEQPNIPDILDGLIADLTPLVDEITALTGTEDVVAALDPILEKVVDLVGGAAGNVDGLLGSPVAAILTSASGTLPISVSDVAQLIVKVLTLLSSILDAALKLVDGDLSKLNVVIGAINQVVSQLVIALLGEVDGLLSSLLPLVSGLVPILASLGLGTLGSVLSTLTGLLGL
ncbi:hypothetical protein A7U60_g2019 [Sanghuangporus baumii]|uniref:Uncharacterized protein n=1 Tax=Sanghuangporus baumii TaxID=108892 RepID=A0A9Q5NB76_SANBA|nr:hypothetical protein A7U60_g2019 [Sanghuangporus baumii]